MDTQQFIDKNLIVKHLAGSQSYGTSTEESDVDIRGVFAADPVNILTPFFPVREHTVIEDEDTKYYELTHFINMCVECNPNIAETLWIDEKHIIQSSPVYNYIRKNRSLFLSKKIAFTTTGYALAQLKRIKGHNKFINSPFKEKPKQTNFISLVQNFTSNKMFKFNIYKFNKDHRLYPYGNNLYGVFEQIGYDLYQPETFDLNIVVDTDKFKRCDVNGNVVFPKFLIKFNKQEYKKAIDKYNAFCCWKQNRNKKRALLEEQYGYDCKHASHLVRLCRMGEEALTTGTLIVNRPDADELLAIRNGAWSYDQLIEYAEYMDNYIRTDLYKTSDLPKKANLYQVAKILMTAQEMVWNKNQTLEY